MACRFCSFFKLQVNLQKECYTNTSRAGLVTIAEVMQMLKFTELVNRYLPRPGSNRGFQPSVFVTSLMLMLHEGGKSLDDLHYIREDKALRKLLVLKQVPTPDAMGDWLRRIGNSAKKGTKTSLTEINKKILSKTLHNKKAITLDIDATLSSSKNKTAKWTYKKCTGYMPMVGHIAETGQVLSTDFREGNISPAAGNLEFIHQCEDALPEGVSVKKLRIDAAGYQAAIIDECIERKIDFAIRAKMNKTLKTTIENLSEDKWQSMVDRNGEKIPDGTTCRLVHAMDKNKHSFTVIVQRAQVKGQILLDLDNDEEKEIIQSGAYVYRAIATNRDSMTDSELIHWYNQRGEASENRIKELKSDFAAGKMPCRDFAANSLFFALCSLAYNLFALMRHLLPARFESCRAKTVRLRLYALAGKVVQHGRKIYLKLQTAHHNLLHNAIRTMRQLAQAP